MKWRVLLSALIPLALGGLGLWACGDPSDLITGNAFAVINLEGSVKDVDGNPINGAEIVGLGYFDAQCRGDGGSTYLVAYSGTTGLYEGVAGIGPVAEKNLPVTGCIRLYAIPPQTSTLGGDSAYIRDITLGTLLAIEADTMEVNFVMDYK